MKGWQVSGALILALAGCGDDGASASAGHALVVADREAGRVYVYDDERALSATLKGQEVADHVGFLPLSDGRVLYVDEHTPALVELDTGRGVEARRVALPTAAFFAHVAVDTGRRFVAVSGSDDSFTEVTLSLVSLADFSVTTTTIEGSEAGLFFAGDPLRLYVREGGNPESIPPIAPSLDVYDVESLRNGGAEPLARLPLGPGPHGEAVVHDDDLVYVATDDGFEVIDIKDVEPRRDSTIPWPVTDRSFGRAFYARLSGDGTHIVSYVRGDADDWWESQNDAFLIELSERRASRIELGSGLTYRCAQAGDYAVYFRLHPDGDECILINVDASSPAYLTRRTLALPELVEPPSREISIWESLGFRATAMSPDGRFAYVSNGSSGSIAVIDTEEATIVDTLTLPTPLDYGGYMVAVPLTGPAGRDTIGR